MSEARTTGEIFEPDPGFDLRRYAERSFGTFCCFALSLVESPGEFAGLFRRRIGWDDGAIREEENPDGSVTVRFKAGNIDEMCWRLFTWGDSVIVKKPCRFYQMILSSTRSTVFALAETW